jgi:hypothetical protein
MSRQQCCTHKNLKVLIGTNSYSVSNQVLTFLLWFRSLKVNHDHGYHTFAFQILAVVPVHAMKVHGDIRWSSVVQPGDHWIRNWVGFRNGLSALVKRHSFYRCRESKTGSYRTICRRRYSVCLLQSILLKSWLQHIFLGPHSLNKFALNILIQKIRTQTRISRKKIIE